MLCLQTRTTRTVATRSGTASTGMHSLYPCAQRVSPRRKPVSETRGARSGLTFPPSSISQNGHHRNLPVPHSLCDVGSVGIAMRQSCRRLFEAVVWVRHSIMMLSIITSAKQNDEAVMPRPHHFCPSTSARYTIASCRPFQIDVPTQANHRRFHQSISPAPSDTDHLFPSQCPTKRLSALMTSGSTTVH